MNAISATYIVGLAGFGLMIFGIIARIRDIMHRPFKKDLSRPAGDERRGILFAFTLGMAPWEKESTRMHWVAYIRGIVFHLGVFVALAAFFASPWVDSMPRWLVWGLAGLSALGALAALTGLPIRLSGENERALSLPDDYFAILLVSLFAALTTAAYLAPAIMPVYHIVTALMFIYIPIGKIRHCVYFFFSKYYFGKGFGWRGVIGQPHGQGEA